jgi:oligosaccharide reducing-end xylanase
MTLRVAKLRITSVWLLFLWVVLPLCGQQPSLNHLAAADGGGVFATGRYRDRFVEDGHREQEVQARLQTAFQQFFHGDPHTQSIYFETGSNSNGKLAYITDWANHDVRTEGMSYGMMIAVQLDRKEKFDSIWNWANTYMKVNDPKNPSYGFFAWSCKTDGTHNSDGPAPDGEQYFAMALYFASARWGDGKGIYDYHSEADALLHAMLHRELIRAHTRFGEIEGEAEVDPAHSMIRFTPNGGGRFFTDPSYHLPAFYELWARWGPIEDRAFWLKATKVSREFFVKTTNSGTALAPVYANWDGTPHTNGFWQSGIFGYDSWRTAINWSVDWEWWHADSAEIILSDRIQNFFATQPAAYADVYTLDGQSRGTVHASGLVAANATVGLAASNSQRAKLFYEELWKTPLPSGQFRYYGGMLWMLSYLHVSGQFRIWTPSWAEKTEARDRDRDAH